MVCQFYDDVWYSVLQSLLFFTEVAACSNTMDSVKYSFESYTNQFEIELIPSFGFLHCNGIAYRNVIIWTTRKNEMKVRSSWMASDILTNVKGSIHFSVNSISDLTPVTCLFSAAIRSPFFSINSSNQFYESSKEDSGGSEVKLYDQMLNSRLSSVFSEEAGDLNLSPQGMQWPFTL